MRQRIIRDENENKIRLDMKDGNWQFKTGDVIQKDDFSNRDFVKVEGFHGGKLYGSILGSGGKASECSLTCIDKPDKLVLVWRPKLKFKLQDSILVTGGCFKGKKGRVVVLDPVIDTQDANYLVELDDCGSGHNGSARWGKPWFPSHFKTPSKSRYWFSVGELKPYRKKREKREKEVRA